MANGVKGKQLGVRILLGVIVGILGLGMLLYLVPGQGQDNIASPEIVAQVGGQPVRATEVQEQLRRMQGTGQLPAAMLPIYAKSVIDGLVFERMLELEAKRLGIQVSDQERVDRIKQLLPTAVEGDTFVGMDRYQAEVQARFQMTVDQFEELVRQSLIQDKIEKLVTAAVTVSPADVKEEFDRRNEKLKMDYVLLNPDNLASKIQFTDADLTAYYEKNKTKYLVPEERVVRYLQIDLGQIEQKTTIPEAELRKYYQDHISEYKVEDRVHAAHILFKTTGKTDAEVAEIQKKAEDVLKQAKSGANFADLAKKYSDDTSKDSGGDLGWLTHGQTVPEFDKAAFSLPKGAISDLVKSQFGFHIIKVLDKETAHTKSYEEMLPTIMSTLVEQRAQQQADDEAQKVGEKIRETGKVTIDQLGSQFGITPGQTKPIGANDTVPELGTAPEIHDIIFQLRPGEISQPIRTDRGYTILSVTQVLPAHQGAFQEVRDRVATDYRHDKALEQAKTEAAELAKRAEGNGNLAAAAKSLGLEMKSSDAFARDGDVSGVGSAKQFLAAFNQPVGKVAPPIDLGTNWLVYRVTDHQQPNQEDLAKQQKDIEQQLLDEKRDLAFRSFREALEAQLKSEGKVVYNNEVVQQLTRQS